MLLPPVLSLGFRRRGPVLVLPLLPVQLLSAAYQPLEMIPLCVGVAARLVLSIAQGYLDEQGKK